MNGKKLLTILKSSLKVSLEEEVIYLKKKHHKTLKERLTEKFPHKCPHAIPVYARVRTFTHIRHANQNIVFKRSEN